MGIKLLNILAKPAKRMLSCADSKAVLEKAVKLGLAPEKVVEIKPLISSASRGEWLRPGQRILPENLGVYLSDGTLRFQSEEKAIEFGKKHIMDALHSANPHEVNVDIAKNGRALGVISGNSTNVGSIADISEELGSQVKVTMHGHPDLMGKGITTAISTADYTCGLQPYTNVEKMIVFNSKGEQYILEKLPNFDHEVNTISDCSEFMKDYYRVMLRGHENEIITGGYTRQALINESHKLNELYMELSAEYDKMCANRTLMRDGKLLNEKARKIITESMGRVNIGEMPAENYKDCLDYLSKRISKLHGIATDIVEADALNNPKRGLSVIQSTHEFWKEFAAKYGVKMETNFSNFV